VPAIATLFVSSEACGGTGVLGAARIAAGLGAAAFVVARVFQRMLAGRAREPHTVAGAGGTALLLARLGLAGGRLGDFPLFGFASDRGAGLHLAAVVRTVDTLFASGTCANPHTVCAAVLRVAVSRGGARALFAARELARIGSTTLSARNVRSGVMAGAALGGNLVCEALASAGGLFAARVFAIVPAAHNRIEIGLQLVTGAAIAIAVETSVVGTVLWLATIRNAILSARLGVRVCDRMGAFGALFLLPCVAAGIRRAALVEAVNTRVGR
jgi:hypothetical protein